MQLKILPLIVLFVISVSLATSCDKNEHDSLTAKLPDPIQITLRSAEKEKVVFNADRPFIYLIQENSTGAILFMGAVKNFNR